MTWRLKTTSEASSPPASPADALAAGGEAAVAGPPNTAAIRKIAAARRKGRIVILRRKDCLNGFSMKITLKGAAIAPATYWRVPEHLARNSASLTSRPSRRSSSHGRTQAFSRAHQA